MVRCVACSLVFTNPILSEAELSGLYPPDYYAYQETRSERLWKKHAKGMLGYWQGTKDPTFGTAGTFLDIGCGSGGFVQKMKERGWDSYGIEINLAAARAGQSAGLKIISGSLRQARFSAESFDYIRASHSLEHMPDPGETLDEIFRILKPNGKLLVAVPNIAGLTARIFKQYWWHLCPPVHTFSYSSKTLSRFLKHHALSIERVIYNSDYVGFLGSLQIWLNRNSGKKSFDGWAFNSRPLRILSSWLQNAFDCIGCGDMIEVTAVRSTDRHELNSALQMGLSEIQAVSK
jgi:ubiquinone/menaquinone biosynthesis C-methylase UbiE